MGQRRNAHLFHVPNHENSAKKLATSDELPQFEGMEDIQAWIDDVLTGGLADGTQANPTDSLMESTAETTADSTVVPEAELPAQAAITVPPASVLVKALDTALEWAAPLSGMPPSSFSIHKAQSQGGSHSSAQVAHGSILTAAEGLNPGAPTFLPSVPLGHTATDPLAAIYQLRLVDGLVTHVFSPTAYGYTGLAMTPLWSVVDPAERVQLAHSLQVLLRMDQIASLTGMRVTHSPPVAIRCIHRVLIGLDQRVHSPKMVRIDSTFTLMPPRVHGQPPEMCIVRSKLASKEKDTKSDDGSFQMLPV